MFLAFLRPYFLKFSFYLRLFSDFLFFILLILLLVSHFENEALDKDINNQALALKCLNLAITQIIFLLIIHFLNFIFFF
jgi:hypothetical protein